MNDQLANPAFRSRLVHKLSRNGKFIVRFVSYPEQTDVREFIVRPDSKHPIRYVNADASTDAKLIKLIS